MTLDQQLKQLAMEAQQHPPKTPERQRALARLVDVIYQSKKLVRPHPGQFYGLYGDIYAEAQQRLFLYMCEHIERYDTQREVLQWANFLMRKRFFIEASRDFMPTAPRGMDLSQVKRITLDALDKQEALELRSQANPSLSEEVIQCIREDRDGLFRETYIRKKPNANFQHIAFI